MRAFDRRHPLLWDLHLTGFWVTAALIDWAGDGWRNIARDPDVPGGLVLVLTLGLSVPLLWRRSHPRTVLLALAPFALVNAWSGAVLQAAMLQTLVVFHIALRRPHRSLWWAAAVFLTPVIVIAVRHPHGGADQDVLPALLTFVSAAAIGITVHTRRDRTEALEDRARRLEIERDQQARLAAAERARIAREMHDIIGHHLSVITGLADGGSLRNGHPYAQLAAGFGVGTTTAYRCITEAVDVLAALAPTLANAIRAASVKAFVLLDGTLLPIDWIAADRPFYPGKHKKHGMNVQVLACPMGRLLWASPALPGAVHDVRAAREHGIVAALGAADIPCWADKGPPGRRRHGTCSLPRPLGDAFRMPAGRQPVTREDPGPRRAGCRHPQVLAAPAQAPVLDHPHHGSRSGRPHPASGKLRVRMEASLLRYKYWASPLPSDQSACEFSVSTTNMLRGSTLAYSSASSDMRRYNACFWASGRPARRVMATYTMPSSRGTPR
jgi:hypothetical protein